MEFLRKYGLVTSIVLLAIGAALLTPHQNQYDPGQPYSYQQASEISAPSSGDERLADYTLGLEIFTGIVAVFTVILAGSSVWLGLLAREESIASRRAWLAIEDPKLEYPTNFGEKGFQFKVAVTIKNLGSTPAKGVWVEFESYYPRGNPEGFLAAQKRFIAKLRERPSAWGEILFPDDTLRQSGMWTDGAEKIEAAIETRANGVRMAGFMIFVGVVYWVAGDPSPRITFFPYASLNTAVGLKFLEGQSADISRMPFMSGEVD